MLYLLVFMLLMILDVINLCLNTEKKYLDAVTQYSLAIDVLPSAILYSNRAMAYLKLEDFGLTIDDANTGV